MGLGPERAQAGLVNGRATKSEGGETYDPLKPIPKSRQAPRGETKGNRDDGGEERHPENRAEAEEQHVDHADRGGWRALQSQENQSCGACHPVHEANHKSSKPADSFVSMLVSIMYQLARMGM